MLIDLVQGTVKDTSATLTEDDFNRAIAAALKRYSKARPRPVTVDIPGNGTRDYDLPDEWTDELSVIQSIEYPAGAFPESMLGPQDWKLYQTPGGKKIRILNTIPEADETLRVTHTGLHLEETVPEPDLEAVGFLAASICCRQLAQLFGQTSDPTLGADVVNYRSKGDEFARRAKELEGLYRQHVGIKDESSTTAALTIREADDSQRPRLTHPRRRGGLW